MRFWHRTRISAAVLILLLGFLLRVYGLTSESLWIDEGYSIELAGRSVVDVVRGTIADQHPPLYYLVLHLWQTAAPNVFHVRYLSVLCGLLGIAVAYGLATAVGGPEAGRWTALWVAVAPMHIWYSQEVRMYILLALLASLSLYLFWRWVHGANVVVAYVTVSVLALYTHNFAVFVLLVQNALMLLWLLLGWQPRRFLKSWVLAQLAIGLGYVIWVPVVFYQARYHQMRWLGAPDENTLQRTLNWLLLGRDAVDPQLVSWLLLALLLGIALFWRSPRRRGMTLAFLWWFLPLALVFAVSQRYPLFQPKQFLIILPGLTLFAVMSLRQLPRLPRVLLIAALLTLNLSALGALYATQTKHGWREATLHIADHYRDGDVLYLNPAAGMLTMKVYFNELPPYRGYPQGYDIVRGGWAGEILTEPVAEAELAPLAGNYRRLWLVEFGPGFWDPQGYFEQWLARHAESTADMDFRGVRVRLYEFTAQASALQVTL